MYYFQKSWVSNVNAEHLEKKKTPRKHLCEPCDKKYKINPVL